MPRRPAMTLEWQVEETCLNAWPALREVLLAGWLLRFSEGLTRRANSANPLGTLAPANPRECEALYRGQGQQTIFRVLSLLDSSADEQLDALSYTSEGESCVLYGDLDGIEQASDSQVTLWLKPSGEWFAAMAALQNHTTEQAGIYRRIVGQLAIPAAFASLSENDETVALG